MAKAQFGEPSGSLPMDLRPAPTPRGLTTTLLVNNIHCASCVAHAQEVLSFLPEILDIDISVVAHAVRVQHGSQTSTTDLVKALVDAAFEVFHASTSNEFGVQINDMDLSWSPGSPKIGPSLRWSSSSVVSLVEKPKSQKQLHLENCQACREEEKAKKGIFEKGPKTVISSTIERKGSFDEEDKERPTTPLSVRPKPATHARQPGPEKVDENEYDAQIGVSGMTCASCVNTVTTQLEDLDFVNSVSVNLLTNSASLNFRGPKDNVDKIIERIEDSGFEGSVDEITPRTRKTEDLFMANLSITGMTCGSCVGTITRGIQETSSVTNVVIDLLGNSGRVEFKGRENLDKIVGKIDDVGYGVTVIDCIPVSDGTSDDDGPKPRTIQIKIDGMFCHHCPQTVVDSLNKTAGETGVVIDEAPTTTKPIVTLTYLPNVPVVTIRNFLAAIESGNQAFDASVHHPPSIEERSRVMQRHEKKRLLWRLLFVFIVAIPAFLIGIVWMALVPKDDKIRMYLEEPMWAGTVMRMDWAMLIITTPVMVYGTDVFHVRALKEIRSLWRRGSRVPLLRRFYRFGSMNLLISAGTSVAYFSSLAMLIVNSRSTAMMDHGSNYFDTVVFLTLFILAGRALEAYSKAKTGDAVASLGKLRPSEAYLVVDSLGNGNSPGTNIQKVSVDLLEVGDTVNVPHGASPPADGLVTGTDASYKFNESSLTGESMPVHKVAGDKVYSGSVNVGQPVSFQITELGGASMLDQIVAVVREGQAKRAPIERFADLATGYFVPIITLIAIVTFILWLSLGESGVLPTDYMDSNQGGWAFWSLKFAISVFVVACPCGLALAAPTALFVGGGLAANRGILVRGGGEAFQEASRLNAIVFDKTGTLTEGGTLRVSDHEVLITDQEQQKIAWGLARTMEETSTHPIAQAIVEFCRAQESVPVLSSTISEIGGQGMKGTFSISTADGDETYEAAIGNQRLLESIIQKGIDTYYLDNLLSRYQSAGRSTAVLSMRKSSGPEGFIPAIVFATSDPIRAEAPQVIADLRARNIDVYMCTGDNAITAHAVASSLGIPSSNVIANVLPAGKADYIRSVQQDTSTNSTNSENKNKVGRKIIGFVGDGTNDSPALAAADVSIAMASGSDVAVNSAGFILLKSDLRTILELCILSRRVFRRVKWNFLWAAVYNISLIPIAAGVLYPIVTGHKVDHDGTVVNTHWRLDPVWAALAMALSSLSVVLSSLALKLEFRDIKKWVLTKLGKGGATSE